MKKIIASFVLALIVCSSSFAVKAWEFEFKGLGGYNHVSEYALGEKNTLDDFLVGGGIDITRCWGDHVGIDFSLTYLQPMFNKSVYKGSTYTCSDISSMTSGVCATTGLAIMFPLSDKLKIKTVHGFGVMNYDRGIKRSVFTNLEESHSGDSNDSFTSTGYFGSAGVVYMPLKHFGISGGVDYSFAFVSLPKNLESGYEYKDNFIGYSFRPFIGGTIRLGRKL